MRRTIATALVLAVMSGGAWARQSVPQTSGQRTDVANKKRISSKKSGRAVAAAQGLPSQTMPPVPATLMNSAPVKPFVTMERGLLTIDAPNSTLSDVLSGVHKATGATIEGASPTERVAIKLGPGNPEQVIADLLRGTPYDYVILGTLGRLDLVTRVLLTQQSSQASADASPSPSDASGAQETRQQPPANDGLPERSAPDDAATALPNSDNEPDQAQQPQQPQQQDPNQPKTPEQLFKELQQLEQQKQPK